MSGHIQQQAWGWTASSTRSWRLFKLYYVLQRVSSVFLRLRRSGEVLKALRGRRQHGSCRRWRGYVWHRRTSGNELFFSLALKAAREGEKKCHSPGRLDMLTLLWSEKQPPWQPLSNSGTGCLGELGKASLFVIVGRGFSLALRPPILQGEPTRGLVLFPTTGFCQSGTRNSYLQLLLSRNPAWSL